MAISLGTPVTGSAQTGFTSPTYTIAQDNATSLYAKQWYVSACGGTQTGANVHSVSLPFTFSFFRPASLAVLPPPNSVGVIPSFPKNVYKAITRKGMAVASGTLNGPQIGFIRSELSIPAGADTQSPSEIRAMISMHIGALTSLSASIGDTTISGVI